MTSNDERTRVGYVIMLDALGTRNRGTSHAIETLDSIAYIERELEKLAERNNGLPFGEKCTAHTLGDTFAFTISVPKPEFASIQENKNNEPDFDFSDIAFTLEHVVSHPARFILQLALLKNMPIRGAISFGEFAYGNNSLVGQAVSDVVAWHEKADWIGVVLTPKLGIQFEKSESFICGNYRGDFIQYDVPLSGKDKNAPNKAERLWCLSWAKKMDSLEFKKLAHDHGLRDRQLFELLQPFAMDFDAFNNYVKPEFPLADDRQFPPMSMEQAQSLTCKLLRMYEPDFQCPDSAIAKYRNTFAYFTHDWQYGRGD